jgi:hypothetical protein
MDKQLMRRAFRDLDDRLEKDLQLVVGGGAAMILAYDHPLATEDVDAFPRRGSPRLAEIDALAKQTARTLGIASDWLNQHFETFTFVLPDDYAARLRNVYRGKHLSVEALGPEDILVMKCFAGRDKDRPHARRLMQVATDLDVVDRQLSVLASKRVANADRAAAYFDDLRDELDL